MQQIVADQPNHGTFVQPLVLLAGAQAQPHRLLRVQHSCLSKGLAFTATCDNFPQPVAKQNLQDDTVGTLSEVGSAVHANHPERPARFHSDGTQPASFRPWDMPVKHSLRARGLTLRLSLPAAFLCLRLPARPASRLPFRPARFSFRARGLILRLSRPAAFLCLRLPALPA